MLTILYFGIVHIGVFSDTTGNGKKVGIFLYKNLSKDVNLASSWERKRRNKYMIGLLMVDCTDNTEKSSTIE
jgi:hypothetical protein